MANSVPNPASTPDESDEAGSLKDVRGIGIWLQRTEDSIYLLVAIGLAGLCVVMAVSGFRDFVSAIGVGLRPSALQLLNDVLLVLMFAELFHTVRISLRDHTLAPEPFLVVALIGGIRRLLVITAEQGSDALANPTAFRLAMLELGLLTFLVVAFVGALIALWREQRRREGK